MKIQSLSFNLHADETFGLSFAVHDFWASQHKCTPAFSKTTQREVKWLQTACLV